MTKVHFSLGHICILHFAIGNNFLIIIGSDRRPETKQGIEGKTVRFRSGRVSYNWLPMWTRSPIWTYQFWCLLNSDRRFEPNTVHNFYTSTIYIQGSSHK